MKLIENTVEVSVEAVFAAGGHINEWNAKQELKSFIKNGNQVTS